MWFPLYSLTLSPVFLLVGDCIHHHDDHPMDIIPYPKLVIGELFDIIPYIHENPTAHNQPRAIFYLNVVAIVQ